MICKKRRQKYKKNRYKHRAKNKKNSHLNMTAEL